MIGTLIILIIIAATQVLMGIAYLKGKCDGFIAGYNTAPLEEQQKYDIKKLRLLIACFRFALAGLFFVLLFRQKWAAVVFMSVLAVLIIVLLILARTWAKKK